MTLRVYSTLARKKEEFLPRDSGRVGIYVCGPTVYNYIHIGNARCYVAFDAIVRYLEFCGYQVTYVRNLTDIDDKIIKRAQEEKITSRQIADKYIKAFHEDMEAMGCRKPDIEPKATETISDMQKIVEGLVDKGFAYEVDGDVFFEINKFEDYGKLSRRTLDEMRAGERVDVDPRKRHPMDFALWKGAKPGEPSWPSPWGEGRPGWHVECSAMSLCHLKMSFDIHAGGQDLIFPHHENEIAQSEAYTGTKPFVKYWLHNGFVTIKEEKMAKSVGNVTLVSEIGKWDQYIKQPIDLKNHLRMFFLSTHYRSPIDFSRKHLEEAGRKVSSLVNLLWRLDHELEEASFDQTYKPSEEKSFGEKIDSSKEKFVRAMDDDFNTPAAIGALFELEKDTNIFMDEHPNGYAPSARALLERVKSVISELGEQVLGLSFESKRHQLKLAGRVEIKTAKVELELKRDLLSFTRDIVDRCVSEESDTEDLIKTLVEEREKARKEKDFSTADSIRARLTEIGVVIEDTPHGARWKWK